MMYGILTLRSIVHLILVELHDAQPWTTLGGALTWHFTEGALARLVYQAHNIEKSTRNATIVPQLLVEF